MIMIFDYDDGIVIGSLGGKSSLILSNYHGYLGFYWGYRSFRPTRIRNVQDLNDLKSKAINHGAKMDWGTFQWVLNNFELLSQQHEVVA